MLGLLSQIRALGASTALYRIIASLAGCASLYGFRHGGTPVTGAASICRALSVPAAWTVPTAAWCTAHAQLVGSLGILLAVGGILALPTPDDYGGDIGLALEWRSPSTAVLGLSALLQARVAGWMVGAVLIIVLGVWVACHRGSSYRPAELLLAAATAVPLAVLFVPLYAAAWLFTRDVEDALRQPDA